jgi:hypothetical protein
MGVKTIIIISGSYPDILDISYSYNTRVRGCIFRDFLSTERRAVILTNIFFLVVEISTIVVSLKTQGTRVAKIELKFLQMITIRHGIWGNHSVSDHSSIFSRNPRISCIHRFSEPIFMTRNYTMVLGRGS